MFTLSRVSFAILQFLARRYERLRIIKFNTLLIKGALPINVLGVLIFIFPIPLSFIYGIILMYIALNICIVIVFCIFVTELVAYKLNIKRRGENI